MKLIKVELYDSRIGMINVNKITGIIESGDEYEGDFRVFADFNYECVGDINDFITALNPREIIAIDTLRVSNSSEAPNDIPFTYDDIPF